MEDGTLGDTINPWGVAMFQALEGVEPGSASEEAAYGKWLDQTETRQQARQDRVHGAAGVIPTPLWIVLFFITCIVFVYLLCFADSGERTFIQGLLMGSVVATVTAMLLLLSFLDDPYHSEVGGRAARGDGAHARPSWTRRWRRPGWTCPSPATSPVSRSER